MSQRGPAGSLAVSLTPPAATGDPRQRAGAVVVAALAAALAWYVTMRI